MSDRIEVDRLPWRRGAWRPSVGELAGWLTCGLQETKLLYAEADALRLREVGDEVHLRGLIEFSNFCVRRCDYCGIRAPNRAAERYRMSPTEIVTCALRAKEAGCGTVVLQSGEDPWWTTERLCALVRDIKKRADLAVTLSVGERPARDYQRFREAGCDRYLLRFETSDEALYARLHPDGTLVERLKCLEAIRAAGLQVGSGFMIGLPFSGVEHIARDILFATELHLDMIGCGPYIAHPGTPLAGAALIEDREVYFRVISLLRLLNPRAHIPAATAFDALAPSGRDFLLQRGANVFMPNMTPAVYRRHYMLYPGKPCVDEDAAACAACVRARIARLNRRVGAGPGHSLMSSRADAHGRAS